MSMKFGGFPGRVRAQDILPLDDLEVTEVMVYTIDNESVITLINKPSWSAAFVRLPLFSVLVVKERET